MNSREDTDRAWAAPAAASRRDDASPDASHSVPATERDARFDSVSSALSWWYQPVLESETWLALGHLFVGALLGPLLFAAATVTVTLTASLSLAVIGLFLVVPAFGFIDSMAGLERRRAAWVDGAPIPPRRKRRADPGLRSAVTTRVGDPARWRQVSYLLLLVLVGPILFAIGSSPWFLVVELVTGPTLGNFEIGGLVLGAVVVGAAPRVTRFVAGVATSFAAWFLGPDANSDLEERVVELSSQRDHILDAVANERRRIERNLHDGVQQQLVALGIDIGRARSRVETDPDGARELLADASEKVRGSIGELRMIGRGLHPAVLSDRGLDAALSAVVANAPIPITVDVSTTHELSTELSETAYYVVNESVANVLKHARARVAVVRVQDEPGALPAVRIVVEDDGRGGADAGRSSGSGLAGIVARVEGHDGVVIIDSPEGGPTVVTAVIPIRRPRPTGGNPP